MLTARPHLIVALCAGVLLFLDEANAMAGVIQWTGTATVSFGEGNSFVNVPAANPIINLNAPGSFTGTVPGISSLFWNVSLTNAPNGEQIQLSAFANQVQASVVAVQPAVSAEQHKFVRIAAQYSITSDPTIPTTIGLQTNGSVNVSGSLVNTVGLIDEVRSLATLTLSETSTVPGGELFSNQMIREFHKIDNLAPPVISKDLIPSQIANKPNGVYNIQVDIELAALAIGNAAEERASATWSSAVALSLGTFDAISTTPEPATWFLAVLGAAAVTATKVRRRIVARN